MSDTPLDYKSTPNPSVKSGPLPPAATVRQVARPNRTGNFQFRGSGQVTGTTKNKATPNAPVGRRVRLVNERLGTLVAETWSDSLTGYYEFLGIDKSQLYTVISYDHTLNFRAVIADRVTPDPMP